MSWLSTIEEMYGLKIRKCTQVRDVYRIETTQHALLCLKPYRIPQAEVEFIAMVQQHLVNQGFLYSPRTKHSEDGKPYVDSHQCFYMLTNWVKGHAPNYRDAFELEKSVKLLARFHQHAKHLSGPIPQKRNRSTHIEARFQETKQLIRSRYHHESAAEFTALSEEALERLRTAPVQEAILHETRRKAFVHGDYNYPNLVLDNRKRQHLIDFDNTSLYVRMEDLAHIIHRNHAWEMEGAQRLIEIYDKVRPISRDDMHLLVALLYDPYPVTRAIHQNRQHSRWFQATIPPRTTVIQYRRQLKSLA